jgi:hypothetical protein
MYRNWIYTSIKDKMHVYIDAYGATVFMSNTALKNNRLLVKLLKATAQAKTITNYIYNPPEIKLCTD